MRRQKPRAARAKAVAWQQAMLLPLSGLLLLSLLSLVVK